MFISFLSFPIRLMFAMKMIEKDVFFSMVLHLQPLLCHQSF